MVLRAAHVVARVAITASLLSVIGGLIVGIEASKYRAFDAFGGIATHHHPGVIAYWIAIGEFTAAVWLALAVGLELLADVGGLCALRRPPTRRGEARERAWDTAGLEPSSRLEGSYLPLFFRERSGPITGPFAGNSL